MDYYPKNDTQLTYNADFISWGNGVYFISDEGSIVPKVSLPNLGNKLVALSRDNSPASYINVPTGDASLTITADSIDNTVYGSGFSSAINGLKSWESGFTVKMRKSAGFRTSVKRPISSTPVTKLPLSPIGGGVWSATVNSQSLWDSGKSISVFVSGAKVHNDNLKYISPLEGKVFFADHYTPSGLVTVDANILTLEEVGCVESVSLSVDSDIINMSCFKSSKSGFHRNIKGLKKVKLDMKGFHSTGDTVLHDNDDVMIEVDVEGNGNTLVRGNYRLMSIGLSGDVGGVQDSDVTLSLNVKEGVLPFAVTYNSDSKLPVAMKDVLSSVLGSGDLHIRYMPYGYSRDVFQGEVIVNSVVFTSSVTDLCNWDVALVGEGVLKQIPPYLVRDGELKPNPEFTR